MWGKETPSGALHQPVFPQRCTGLQPSAGASLSPPSVVLGQKCRSLCAGDICSIETGIAQASDPHITALCNQGQKFLLPSFIYGTRGLDFRSEYVLSLNNFFLEVHVRCLSNALFSQGGVQGSLVSYPGTQTETTQKAEHPCKLHIQGPH